MSAHSVAEVLDLYERWGPNHYDEDLSQLDHALQTAALAAAAGAGEPLIAAALLHDVGHLLDLADGLGRESHGRQGLADVGDLAHEATGARHLASIFPASVTGPIALHVRAKRYRCAVDPAYQEALSAGSTASLERQGGPMAPDEVARFEAHPSFADAVELRRWDDAGKVDGLEVPPIEQYVELLARLATTQGPVRG